jgi:hypothetical protein
MDKHATQDQYSFPCVTLFVPSTIYAVQSGAFNRLVKRESESEEEGEFLKEMAVRNIVLTTH